MIVTCENCKAKFGLDENLIKESGSKVRCSKCQHIFTAFRPAPTEEVGPLPGLEDEVSEQPDVSAEEPTLFAEEGEIEAPATDSEELSEESLDLDLLESEGAEGEEPPRRGRLAEGEDPGRTPLASAVEGP